MQYSGEVFLKANILGKVPSLSNKELGVLTQEPRESTLIQNAVNGDLAAFNELVLLYQDVVYRQALWMLREEEAAEDATQESFIKAYRRLGTFQAGKPFRPWLLKITTNQCLDMIRAASRHYSLPLEPLTLDGEVVETSWMKDPSETPEQMVERAEIERRIDSAIQQLSPVYRTVVILADLQELDYAEVSAILGIPLGTMKSRLSRARDQLRRALQ